MAAPGTSMMLSGEQLSDTEVKEVVTALLTGELSTLTIRNCTLHDRASTKLFQAVADSISLRILSFTCGTVNDVHKARLLSRALKTNTKIRSLSLHGNPLAGVGIGSLGFTLLNHKNLSILDLGDCQLTDDCMPLICDLLPPCPQKQGLRELSLSGNTGISLVGWNKLCVALAASNNLRALMLDYNKLGDVTACALAVALAARPTVQLLDLECCAIRDHGAMALHFLITNYPVKLRLLNLRRNRIRAPLLKAIGTMLGRSVTSDDPDFYTTMDVTGGAQDLESASEEDLEEDEDEFGLPAGPTLALISSRRSKKRRLRELLELEATQESAKEEAEGSLGTGGTGDTGTLTEDGSTDDNYAVVDSVADQEVADIMNPETNKVDKNAIAILQQL